MAGQALNIWAFDTEDNGRGKPYLYNFYSVKFDRHYTFTEQTEALDFVCCLSNVDIWCCNLEYDVNNLFRDHYALCIYSYADSRLLSCKLDKGFNVKFYDTMNHWHMSVKDMGERIKLPKLEMKHTASVKVTKKKIEYCRRDTEIVARFVTSMDETYDSIGAKLKMTIGSTTMDLFERIYYKRMKNPFTMDQIDFFHSGYYGGRTEIFYTKPVKGPIFYHDVNSLYPYCLRNFDYPSLDVFYNTLKPKWELFGMADVAIVAPKGLNIPYLPARHDNKLTFPLGSWRGVYTYFEVREAKKLGYTVKKVYRAVEFPGTCAPFVEFVDDIYKARMKAKSKKDEMLTLSYKLLMNNLYGKFAQRNEVTKMLPLDGYDLKTGDVIFADLVLTKTKEEYTRYANCIWACYCTAYARHTLYQGLSSVQATPNAILLYCDTDSILYRTNGRQLFPDSGTLGQFKTETCPVCKKHYFDYAHFKQPKLYTLCCDCGKKSYKAKGVPSRVAKDFFKTGKASFRRPHKLRETLRRNLSPKNKRKLIPNFWDMHEKEMTTLYTKRKTCKNGTTKPITISES